MAFTGVYRTPCPVWIPAVYFLFYVKKRTIAKFLPDPLGTPGRRPKGNAPLDVKKHRTNAIFLLRGLREPWPLLYETQDYGKISPEPPWHTVPPVQGKRPPPG